LIGKARRPSYSMLIYRVPVSDLIRGNYYSCSPDCEVELMITISFKHRVDVLGKDNAIDKH